MPLVCFSQQQQNDSTTTKEKSTTSIKKDTVSSKVQQKVTSKVVENKTSKTSSNQKSTSQQSTKSTKTAPQKPNVETPDDPSLKGQFDKIYRTSTKYQTYKVISIDKFNTLKSNVLDSIQKANKTILDKEKQLAEELIKIEELNKKLDKTEADLKIALTKENSILLFGAELPKVTYNLILWSIILVLGILLTLFIVRFSRSNVLTKKAQESLIEVEEEFEMHRKKSLEREQKLRRKLQDEINKQRNI
jgi:hypothetical protein